MNLRLREQITKFDLSRLDPLAEKAGVEIPKIDDTALPAYGGLECAAKQAAVTAHGSDVDVNAGR